MFSFFVKIWHGVGRCRGDQMAERLGGKLNPTDGFEDDVCIFVKDRPNWRFPDGNFPLRSYYDVNDHPRACTWLLDNPMKVIVVSKTMYAHHSACLNRKDLLLIPHHHCNYNRELRPERDVTTVGVIGNSRAFYGYDENVRKMFRENGFNFIYEQGYTRELTVELYKSIDIQVVWRLHRKASLRDPMKLSNAGSFGIPTVAYPEQDFVEEWGDNFIPVHSLEEMMKQCCKLRDDKAYYAEMSNRALVKAEEYHIEHIAKLYQQLEG